MSDYIEAQGSKEARMENLAGQLERGEVPAEFERIIREMRADNKAATERIDALVNVLTRYKGVRDGYGYVTANAALASPAPVAEVVEPNEIPFTDSCVGCGKKFTEVKICCDKGCTLDESLHRKGKCEGCCQCEPDAPVAEAGQKEGE